MADEGVKVEAGVFGAGAGLHTLAGPIPVRAACEPALTGDAFPPTWPFPRGGNGVGVLCLRSLASEPNAAGLGRWARSLRGYVEHRSIDGSGSRMHLLADVALGHVRGESFEGRVHLGVVHDAG